MKILYDCQIFNNQDFGGISRYFCELFKSYQHDDSFNFELPIKYTDNIYIKELDELNKNICSGTTNAGHYQNFLRGFNFRGKRKLYHFKHSVLRTQPFSAWDENKKLIIPKLKEGNFDLFHPTYYDDYFLEFIGEKPYVVTVYDMIHQIFPEYFLWGGMDKSKTLLQKASTIIAISECTKKDLVSIYGIDEKKVQVTHLANSLLPVGTGTDAGFVKQLPGKYLLFVGNRSGYKNFYFFLLAYSALIQEFKDLYVVCTGSPFDKNDLNYFEKLGIKDKIYQYYIDDTKLSILYQHASAFIFPSQYEGFGIPVLEAFACGCPVINSSAASLPEIGGDAAVYFEAKNMGSLVSAIRLVISDNNFRNAMIEKGYEQLKKFSWTETASQTKEIYKRVFS